MSVTKSIALPSGLLKDISMERLEKILNDDGTFYEFFSSLELEEIKNIHSKRDQVVVANRELALESLNLKPTYDEKKAKLVETNLAANELNDDYNQRYQKLKTFIKTLDQKTLLKDLRDLAKESEKHADEMIETFLDNSSELEPEAFIKNFMESRCTYWKRKVKADKMDEMLTQGPVGITPYPAHSRSEPNFPVAGSQPPYPNNPPAQSLPPNGPYLPTARRSLPTSSMQYPPPKPPPYSSVHPSPHQPYPTSAPVPYPPSGPRQPMPSYPPRGSVYPTQNTGYRPPPPRPTHPHGYLPPTSSYRPPPMGQSIPPSYGYSYQPPPPPPRRF